MSQAPTRPTLVVIGAGIAGLAAAAEGLAAGARVVVLEAGSRVGGKLRTEPFLGRPVDLGADAFLTRRPEAMALASQVGLADDLVAPASGRAWLLGPAGLKPLPEGLVLGVPSDPLAVLRSGVVSRGAVARLLLDVVKPGPPLLAKSGDAAIGALVRARLGDEIEDVLVDPLLGGINAGEADLLSARAGVPQLASAFEGRRSAVLAVRAQRRAGLRAARRLAQDADPAWLARLDRTAAGHGPVAKAAFTSAALTRLVRASLPERAGGAGTPPPAPVFLAPKAGMERLADKTLRSIVDGGAEVFLRWKAAKLRVRPDGRFVVTSDAGLPLEADAIVVALPPAEAAALLEPVATEAATRLAGLGTSSVALVALGYRRADVEHALDGSGLLVGRRGTDGLLTACSWFTSKWPHLGGSSDTVVLRASAGRAGDGRALALDDATLIARLHAELAGPLGLRAEPIATRVTRWIDGFPQYAPGHGDVVAAIRADLPPGLAAAGAAYEGVGVPACIGSGRRAARTALAGRSTITA